MCSFHMKHDGEKVAIPLDIIDIATSQNVNIRVGSAHEPTGNAEHRKRHYDVKDQAKAASAEIIDTKEFPHERTS
jgi:hypothetical protein